MKKFITFLVILSTILSLAVLGGCDNQEIKNEEPPITEEEPKDDEKHETAKEIYYNQFGHEFFYDHYYGTFEGAEAYFCSGSMDAVYGMIIGGNIFKYGSYWVIYIFKDSTVYMLEDAYKSGILSKQAIADLADAHAKYVQSIFDQPDEYFNSWYYNPNESIDKIIE